MLTKALVDRFHSKCSRVDSGCVHWGAGKFKDGYGGFWASGKMHRAHRIAWELVNGPIQDAAMQVLHRCDNPICVNPDHLFIGTMSENMRDKEAKGRSARGEKAGLAKLTESEVRDIRSSPESASKLAPKYGVSFSTICYLRRGETWRGV